MSWRQPFFKQQAHWIAFVAKRGLYSNQHIAELFAQHHDGVAVAELAPGSRAPLRFDLIEPAFAFDMIVGRNQGMDIGISTMQCSVALKQTDPQVVNAGRHVHGVALRLHRKQGVKQGFKNRQIRCTADIASIGRKVKNNYRHLALRMFSAAQRDQLFNPCRQHQRALGT